MYIFLNISTIYFLRYIYNTYFLNMQYIFNSSYNTVVYTVDIQYLIVEIAFVLSKN